MKRLLAVLALLCCIAPVVAPATSAQAAAGDWRSVRLPFLWTEARITDVSAAGPSDVWIGGYQGKVCFPEIAMGCMFSSAGNPVARQWNGSAWKEHALPWYLGNGGVEMLAAGAPDNVWLTAYTTEFPTYLAHFDGSKFTKIQPPVPLRFRDLAVFAGEAGTWLSAEETDGPAFYRRVGDGWNRTQAGDIHEVVDVAARTPTDAWAVGPSRVTGRAAVARWDGTSWRAVEYSRDGGWLTDVLPVSSTEVWASTGYERHRVRWDGSTWSRVELPDGINNPSLVADGSGTVWLAGTEQVTVDGVSQNRVALMSYTDGAWRRVQVPLPPGATWMAVSGFTSVPGTDTLWLTGIASTGPVVMTNE